MRQTKEIFAEYSRMRDNGLDAKAALNVLRNHIEGLSKGDREALAGMMRVREAAANPKPAAASPAAVPPAAPPAAATGDNAARPPKINSIRPLGAAAPEQAVNVVPVVPNVAPVAAGAADNVVWVTCQNCGKTNQQHEVFCYSCGQLLEPVKGVNDTRMLSEQPSAELDSEHFGSDSVLVLRVRGSAENFEVRPQKSDHEMVIGRGTKGSVLAPDIDLTDRQAGEMGVSRLHLSISYDQEHSTVLVADLGSANGSFINGQRMMPKEVRVLRHGDELRLGKLVLLTSFRHPR